MNSLLILLGKFIVFISCFFNFGNGSTWPGHIALSVNKNFLREVIKKNPTLKIILIAGTNGKTTTGKLIQTILEKSGKKVFQNQAGANLLNGIVSSLISNSSFLGKINKNFAIFEIDENTLPLILKEIKKPDFVILLNLFRDQLDRYGEINIIVNNWKAALESLPDITQMIVNADDPQIAYLGLVCSYICDQCYPNNVINFFGLSDKNFAAVKSQHAADSIYCPGCGTKLVYKATYFSHLGDWFCKKCGLKRPELDQDKSPSYPLLGIYNKYNVHAALLFAKLNNISNETAEQALKSFIPAFGRQEILDIDGKKVQIFLSKNPTSFNESLRTIRSLKAKNLLLVLNDRIPDGRDVSWIWDVDFEDCKFEHLTISGERVYDMALRIKYATQNSNVKSQNYNSKFKTYKDLSDAIQESLKLTDENETLYILPTYSAMLEVRKILTGKKLL